MWTDLLLPVLEVLVLISVYEPRHTLIAGKETGALLRNMLF